MSNNIIYKYVLDYTKDINDFNFDDESKVLTIQMQNGQPTMWVLRDLDAPLLVCHYRIIGTEQPFDFEDLNTNMYYIDTFQDGPLVWHVFEIEQLEIAAND